MEVVIVLVHLLGEDADLWLGDFASAANERRKQGKSPNQKA
jgi:hypothetical protein